MTTGNTSSRTVDLDKAIIEPFDSNLDRTAFCCGNTKIDNFFRNNIREQHEKCRVRAYTCTYSGDVAGYYILAAASHPPDEVSPEAQKKFGRVKSTPCIYLGMIGVGEKYQKCGMGQLLMLHAMRQTEKISQLCGVYAMTLHAVDKAKADWYRKIGFEYFIDGELAMFKTLSQIKQDLAALK